MEEKTMIRNLVKELTDNDKMAIIKSIKERELHREIRSLLLEMYPGSYVEITCGVDEYGRDLVMVRKDPLGDRVVGIVVKRGDIKTRASGRIDEIVSQVSQSFLHPVSLKGFEFQGDMNITYVSVMLAGMPSKQAIIRLKVEINKPIERPNLRIRDLKWLIDSFTEYYPYVFYEGAVSKYIESSISQLERKHMFSSRHKYLSEYYVEPTVAKLERTIELKDADITLTILKERVRLGRLAQELKPSKKFIMLGDPGVGKSTALVKMAIDILMGVLREATRDKKNGKLGIPIFITAREFLHLSDVSELMERFGPSVETRDRFKVVALLIDGLDEVESDYRQALLDKADEYARELECSLVISTRKVDIVKREILGYEKRLLLPFEFGQAVDMLRRLAKDESMLKALKDGLEKIENQITLTPLSLLFLIELVENNKEVPASITELYDRFTDMALGMEDKSRKGIDILFDYEVKKRFLAELAFERFFNNNQTEMEISEFESFIDSYASEYKWNAEMLRNFADEIERAGILEVRETVKFAHKSLLDYFIAVKIDYVREEIPELDDYLTRIYFGDVWSDVPFYFIGLKKTISKELIGKILGFGGGGEEEEEEEDILLQDVQKLMLGRLLQAAWHSKSEIKTNGIKGSLEYSDGVTERFLSLARARNPLVAEIYADIYTLIICEMSYGSRFLINESVGLINESLDDPTGKGIIHSIRLLWSIRDKIDSEASNELTSRLFEMVKRAEQVTGNEYAKSLLMLRILASREKRLHRIIEKKVRKELSGNPKLFSKLIPFKIQRSIKGRGTKGKRGR